MRCQGALLTLLCAERMCANTFGLSPARPLFGFGRWTQVDLLSFGGGHCELEGCVVIADAPGSSRFGFVFMRRRLDVAAEMLRKHLHLLWDVGWCCQTLQTPDAQHFGWRARCLVRIELAYSEDDPHPRVSGTALPL